MTRSLALIASCSLSVNGARHSGEIFLDEGETQHDTSKWRMQQHQVGLLCNTQERIREKIELLMLSQKGIGATRTGSTQLSEVNQLFNKTLKNKKREVILSVIDPYPAARTRFQTQKAATKNNRTCLATWNLWNNCKSG